MGYVAEVSRTTPRGPAALLVRREDGLGVLPLAAIAGLASGLKIKGKTKASDVARDFTSAVNALRDGGDTVTLRKLLNGTPTDLGPWKGLSLRDGKPERPPQLQQVQDALNAITATITATPSVSRLVTAPPDTAAPGGTVVTSATVNTPAGPMATPATVSTSTPGTGAPRGKSSLTARRTPSTITPAPAVSTATRGQRSTLDNILGIVAQIAPATAPVISAVAPNAPTPVNVTVTAPGGSTPTDAAPSFFDTYKVPILAGGALAAVGLVLAMRRRR